jgi:flagellar hook assembly protein FlgD
LISNPVRISPNPFRHSTEIHLTGNFNIKIFDICGKCIRELSGQNKIVWDGKDKIGEEVKSGVYLLLISDGNRQYSEKVIITD